MIETNRDLKSIQRVLDCRIMELSRLPPLRPTRPGFSSGSPLSNANASWFRRFSSIAGSRLRDQWLSCPAGSPGTVLFPE